ncbi:hypothetical protein GCM10027569_87680 [Flindersiella endophytica]
MLFTRSPGRLRFGREQNITSQPFDLVIGPPGKNGAWWNGDTHAVAASTHDPPDLARDRDGHLAIYTAVPHNLVGVSVRTERWRRARRRAVGMPVDETSGMSCCRLPLLGAQLSRPVLRRA